MALNAIDAAAYCAGMADLSPAAARGRDSTEPDLDAHDQLVTDLISALAHGLTMPLAARSCAVSVRTAHRRLAEARAALGVAGTGALVAGSASTSNPAVGEETGGPTEPPLTDRQREVIELVAVGSTTPAIALQLGIAAATVESHLRNARLKLGADTRWQAVATALERCGGGT